MFLASYFCFGSLYRITGGLGLEPEGETQRSLSAMPAIKEEEEAGDLEPQQKEEGEEYCFEPLKEEEGEGEGGGEGVFGAQEDLKDDFRVDAEDIAVEELPEGTYVLSVLTLNSWTVQWSLTRGAWKKGRSLFDPYITVHYILSHCCYSYGYW